eukprot:210431_1
MATLTVDSYHQEIERPLQQSGKSLDLHVHSFIQNFYKHVQYNDRDILLKFIPNECDSIIELNSKFWNGQIQFILETFLICVFMYQWTVEEFMNNIALFSSIPKTSRPWQLVFQYLREFIKYIAEPIIPINNNELIEQKTDDDDDDEEDDCKNDETPLVQELQHPDCNKHSLDRLLYYMFQVHEGMNRRKSHRQIDMVFIPKQLNQINDTFFANKGIKFTKLSDSQNIHDLLDRFHDCKSREKLSFCRGVMLIIGDDNNDMNDDIIYLFELLNTEPVPDGVLQYTEMPMIYNTIHNPEWLDNMITQNNGVIISYHHHNINLHQQKRISTRLYVWYKSSSGRCYGTRVLKEHIINVLKVFCDDNDDYEQYWDEEAQFNDIMYSDFIDLYLKELGFQSESNDSNAFMLLQSNNTDSESVSLCSGTPFSWQTDWNSENLHNNENSEAKLECILSDSESISNQSGTVMMPPSDWSSDCNSIARGISDEESIPSPIGTLISEIEIEVEVEIESENEMICVIEQDEYNESQSDNDIAEMPNPFNINSILLHGSDNLMFRNSLVAYEKNETLFSDVGCREYRIQRRKDMQLLIGYVMIMDIMKRYVMAYWMLIYMFKLK